MANPPNFGHLIVRRDGVLCTICRTIEPIEPGDSGTPLPAFLAALAACETRHPPRAHKDPWNAKPTDAR